MDKQTKENIDMYIKAGLLKKVSAGDIIAEFIYNLENYARLQTKQNKEQTYNECHKKILQIEPNDELGIIIDDDCQFDILLDYIKIRLNELEESK